MVIRVTKAIRNRGEINAARERQRLTQSKETMEYLRRLKVMQRQLERAQGQSSGIHGPPKKSIRRGTRVVRRKPSRRGIKVVQQ